MQENVKNDRFQRNAGIFVRQMFVIMNIILSMFIFSSVTTAAVNPDVQYNGHSYKIFNDGMTWQQAKKYCEDLGGHLVTITSSQEQAVVVGLLRNNGTKNSYWLGGCKNGSVWKWITGENFNYSQWATWQPDGDGAALMIYRNKNPYAKEGLGYWNDVSFTGDCKNEPFFGSENFGFICEWDNISNINHNPQGALEAYGTGVGLLRVVGWALDEDDLNHKVRVHVYVGGTAGNSSVPQFQIIADKDHDKHSGHGFDDTVSVPFSLNGIDYKGFKTIYLYALNDVGEGTWKEIGSLNVFLQYKDIAKQQVTAYMDSALTQKNGTEYVDAGDEVTVVDEAENAYKVVYPLRQGGTKERWVNKHEIFKATKFIPVNDDSIPIKLQELINKWDGQKWNDHYYSPNGKQCKEFAAFVYNQLYGLTYSDVGSTSSQKYTLNYNANKMGCRASQSNLTINNVKVLYQNAQPGDFIQMRRNHGGAHSAILVSKDDKGVTWFEANADGVNGIRRYTYTYDELVNGVKKNGKTYWMNVAMSIYYAK